MSSKFPKEAIRAATELLGVSGKRLSQLRKDLRCLPDDVRFYQTYRTIRQPAKVRDQLNKLVKHYERQLSGGKIFASDGLMRRVEILGDHSRQLLRWQFALTVDAQHPERALSDGRADSAFDIALKGDINLLWNAAEAACDVIARKVTPGRGGRRHEDDWPLHETIRLLGSHFLEATGREAKIFTDSYTTKPAGRFVELAQLCLREVGWDLSLDAVRNNYREAHKRERRRLGVSRNSS